MRSLLCVLIVIGSAACTPTKTEENVTSSGNISSTAPYMWSTYSFPRDLKISQDFNDTEVTQIRQMTSAWELALSNKKDFFSDTERTPEVSSKDLNLDALGEDGVSGIYKITHWPIGLSGGALAVTQIFGRRYNVGQMNEYVRIEHADILVNENLYDFRLDDSKSNYTFDFRTVVLHEMGHFLGLSHKYGTTVMIPSVNPMTVSRAPTSSDASDLAQKYGILPSTASPASAMTTKPVEYKSSPGDTGERVKILIELNVDGECLHKENGVLIGRHTIENKLK